uniref:Uncharacterized protein n=1 Tax=Arundo donax TaxID=35708 RepID=A0A0A9ATA5_ARUDO
MRYTIEILVEASSRQILIAE